MRYFLMIMVWLTLMASMAAEIIKGDIVLAIILAIGFVIQTISTIKALT